jgi:hypothetical protein
VYQYKQYTFCMLLTRTIGERYATDSFVFTELLLVVIPKRNTLYIFMNVMLRNAGGYSHLCWMWCSGMNLKTAILLSMPMPLSDHTAGLLVTLCSEGYGLPAVRRTSHLQAQFHPVMYVSTVHDLAQTLAYHAYEVFKTLSSVYTSPIVSSTVR